MATPDDKKPDVENEPGAESNAGVLTNIENNVGAEDNASVELGPADELERRRKLIVRNLQEVLGEDRMMEILEERELRIYWGTATTGKPHIAYFVPMVKIADFLNAGCEVTILLADLHGYLDNMKAPWDLLALRTEYYKCVVTEMLKSIDVPLEKLKFVQGTQFQLSKEYTLDMYRLSSLVTEHDAKKAGAEVVKQVDHPLISGLLYPGLQALDEEYLQVDAQFGGVDQRKIFTFAEKYLPQLGFAKRVHLMNPMVVGLSGGKMSSSEDDSKIDLLDTPDEIRRKLKKAFCEPGNIQDNGVLAFVKHVIFPALLRNQQFVIERANKYGGDLHFDTYEEVEGGFAVQQFHPTDLKIAVYKYINRLLDPLRKAFENPDLVKLTEDAYPTTKESDFNPTPRKLDLRVGRITEASPHPDVKTMYVKTIDVGDGYPKTIVTTLGESVNVERLIGQLVVVLCNVRTIKMRGVDSFGIALCAHSPETKRVELLYPPYTCAVGAPVYFEGLDTEEAKPVLNPKRKIWEKIQADMKTGNSLDVLWRGKKLITEKGPVKSPSLKQACIR